MRIKHLILLLVLVLIAYWQVAFFQYSLKWDMLDCWLPWRYFQSESLRSLSFPLWNPYQFFGYPFHADQQVPSFYAEALLSGFLFDFNNYTLHVLVVFYIVLGGTGMFFLANRFSNNKQAALVSAITFALSGYFVAHLQHFRPIISAAFTPFLILYYLKLFDTYKIKNVIIFSLLAYLNITGGNHTFTIIISYLFLVIFLHHLIPGVKQKDWKKLRSILIQHLLVLVFVLVLCLPVIYSILQSFPYIERFGGLTLEKAQIHPFSPRSFISFILPFSTVSNPEYFGTDISMSNLYAGILFIPLLALLRKVKLSALEISLLIFALVLFLPAMGRYTPVHGFMHKYLPMISAFRMTSYFAFFSITIFIALISKSVTVLLNKKQGWSQLKNVLVFISVLVFLHGIYLLSKINFSDVIKHFKLTGHSASFILSLDLHERMLLNSFTYLFLSTLLITLLLKFNKYIKPFNSLLLVHCLDLLIAVQLNIHKTGVSEVKPAIIKDYLASMPKGFPVPQNTNFTLNNDQGNGFGPLWRNTTTYKKRIGYEGFSSFRINKEEQLYTDKQRFNEIIEKPLLYFTMQHRQLPGFTDYTAPVESRSNINGNINQRIIVNEFSNNGISIKCKTDTTALLVYKQINYPGWQCIIDGVQHNIIETDKAFLGVFIPPGEHSVVFKYTNKPVIILWYISLVFLIIMLVYLLTLTGKYKKTGSIIAVTVTLVLFAKLLLLKSPSEKVMREKEINHNALQQLYEKGELSKSNTTLLHVSDIKLPDTLQPESYLHFYFTNSGSVKEIYDLLDTCTSNNLILLTENALYPDELTYIIKNRYKLQKSLIRDYGVFNIYSIQQHNVNGGNLKYFGFENQDSIPCFQYSTIQPDTLHIYSGTYSHLADSNMLYGATYQCTLQVKKSQVNVSGQFYRLTNANATIVISIERDRKKVISFYSDVDLLLEPGKWRKIFMVKDITHYAKRGDKLKVFIWSRQGKVWVDELFVNVE